MKTLACASPKKSSEHSFELEQTAASALHQIEDMQYEVALRARGVTIIKKVAIVFDGKGSLVKEG